MPKKKKVKKIKKVKNSKKTKKVKLKNSPKSVGRPIEKKNNTTGQEEKPEIKKIKKQPTEKKIYNLKILLFTQNMALEKSLRLKKQKLVK